MDLLYAYYVNLCEVSESELSFDKEILDLDHG